MTEYKERLGELRRQLEAVWARRLWSGTLTIAAGLLFGFAAWSAFHGRVPGWVAAAPLILAVLCYRRYQRHRSAWAACARVERSYSRALRRVEGEWAGEGSPGTEFLPTDHVYACDLGIFGEGSLFEWLCVARTAIGRRTLAGWLLGPASTGEAVARQQAVRELRDRPDLRERIVLLGDSEFAESSTEAFESWLDSPVQSAHVALRAIAPLTALAVAGLILAGFAGPLPLETVAKLASPFLLFHAAAGALLLGRVRRTIAAARAISGDVQVLRGGLRLLESERFECAKLASIRERVDGGSQALGSLGRLLGALEERNKEWFYMPSLLMMAGTQLALATESWRSRHGVQLRGWLEAWGEFEALNALGNCAHENPDCVFPDFVPGAALLDATGLGHPLLPLDTLVRNDVRLDAGTRFSIVSGSNMSGKSTLLRAIGVNVVLAMAGGVVRAGTLRLSGLAVAASIAPADSLHEGKSRFLAEIARLRQMLDLAAGSPPALFLIDEIFSGTNSRDRRSAAQAVLETLTARGAIGAVSTHDLALAGIPGEGAPGANVHMGSRNGTDPLDFDYRLKPGPSTESNALAIARMAGVPV
jgi:hypothetical protein